MKAEVTQMPIGARSSGPNLPPPETARARDDAFRAWLAAAETSWLECRVRNRHAFPGLTDERTTLTVDRRQGVVQLEAECECCGTTMEVVYGLDDEWLTGELGRTPKYIHPEGYLLPQEARDGGVMSSERRRACKAELRARALATKAQGRSGGRRR
jgi:hypothetical protein